MRKEKSAVGMILVCLIAFYGMLYLLTWGLKFGKTECIEMNDKVKAKIITAAGEEEEYKNMALPVMNAGDQVIFTLQLPQAPFLGANALCFYQYHSEITATCEGDMLYVRGYEQTRKQQMYGNELCIVEIPEKYWGREVTIKVTQKEGSDSSHFTNFRIMRAQDALFYPLIGNGMILIFFSTTLVLSLAALLIWCVGKLFRKKYSFTIMYIGIFSLLVSVWQLSSHRLFYVFFNSEQFCALAEYHSLYLAPVPLFIFLGYIKSKGWVRRVYYAIAAVFAVGYGIASYQNLSANVHLISYEQIIYNMLGLAMALTIVIELVVMRKVRSLWETVLRDGILLAMAIVLAQLILLLVSSRVRSEALTILIQKINLPTVAISIFMGAVIFAASEVAVEIIRQTAKEEQLHRLAYTDVLTGLHNRQFCEEHMEELDVRSRYCIVFMDVDGLKRANDQYGHAMGDKLLETTSQVVRDAFEVMEIGDQGFYGRWGGDEFLAVFKKAEHAKLFTDNLKRAIAQVNLKKLLPFELMISYGQAVNEPDDRLSPEQVRDHADEAMYAYKKAHNRGRAS